MKAKKYDLPKGTKTATARAFEIAISALEGKEINPVPQARPRMAEKLRRAYAVLVQERIVYP